MIQRDFLMRIFERMGRELSILLGLRKRNEHDEALIYLDDFLYRTIGLNLSFANTLSPEMLLKALSPLDRLNVEACLWTAFALKVEGDTYEEMGRPDENYYRYTRALLLYLEFLQHERVDDNSPVLEDVHELLDKLADYDLPDSIKERLVNFYERDRRFDLAENQLFDLLEDHPEDQTIRQHALAFYQRLQRLSNAELIAGNLPCEEVEEGLAKLQEQEE
jgi:hypothetical protein